MPTTEGEWKKKLTPEQFEIFRKRGTERPFSGTLLNDKRDGTYNCAACGNPLFSSGTKFDSGSGWPSFDQAIPGSMELHEDYSEGMRRTEVVCARCKGHLGHVFNDGPAQTTGQRYCINSVCLDLKPTEQKR